MRIMGRTLRVFFLGTSLVWVPASHAQIGEPLKTCTLIGCFDQIGIHIPTAGRKLAETQIDYVVEFDGVRVNCFGPRGQTIPESGGCDRSTIRIEVNEITDCSQALQDLSTYKACVNDRRFEDVVVIFEKRKAARVSIRRDGKTFATKLFRLKYVTWWPNGKACGECVQAREDWIVNWGSR